MFLLLWLLPLTVLAADTARVWIELDSKSVELGKPLHATLHTRGIDRTPTLADLVPLQRSFALTDSSEVETKGAQKSLAFTLYPRRSGAIRLPSLEIAGHRSEPMDVEVLAAESRGIQLSVKSRISTPRPWVRQQVLVILEVITPERFASLEVESPRLPDFEVMLIPGKREWIETPAGKRSRLRTGFALFPLTSGTHTLRLPPIGYRLEGGIRRLFALPVIKLEVKALPPYVPPTLPVGKVSIGATLQNEGWLYPRDLEFWNIELKSKSVPPQWLPPVQPMLANPKDIRFLPAALKRIALPDDTGVNGRNEYRIPFDARSEGSVALPALSVDYFDPDSGKLARSVYPATSLWVFGYPVRIGMGGIILILLVWSGKRFLRFVFSVWHRQRERRAAITALAHSKDAAAARAALRRYASAGGGTSNLSITEVQQKIGRNICDDEIERLLTASYGASQDIDLTHLRKKLVEKLTRKRGQGPAARG